MKLCFLAGANSIHSYRWVKFFADKGYDVSWISLAPSIFDRIDKVHYYEIAQFPITVFSILRATLRVKKLLKEICPDILHLHSAGTYGLVGALTGFRPLVVTAWGSDVLYGVKSVIKRPLVKFSLSKADLITCDAEHMKDAMVSLGVTPSKIEVIYFGIDTKKFCPSERSEAIKAEHGVHSAPVIISLRNFEPVYDIRTLIQAIPVVIGQVPEARFIIVGKGSLEGKLKKLAEELGVSEVIRFVGFIPNLELPKYLASVDIYVSTSLSDAGIAASTAEAMACGLPVVITDSGENRKWVTDGESGFIVPISAPEILAEKIIFLLKNEEARKRLGAMGRRIIEEKNDYYLEMQKMEELYMRLMKSGRH